MSDHDFLLMDVDTRNVVGCFDTLDAAQACVRETIALYGASSPEVQSLALGFLGDEREAWYGEHIAAAAVGTGGPQRDPASRLSPLSRQSRCDMKPARSVCPALVADGSNSTLSPSYRHQHSTAGACITSLDECVREPALGAWYAENIRSSRWLGESDEQPEAQPSRDTAMTPQ